MLIYLEIKDIFLIILYVCILLYISYYHYIKKTNKSFSDYILAGRKLTLPLFIATLVSTYYGGIFGISEFTIKYGLVNLLTQGIFWYIIYFIFAIFLAKRIRILNFYTIPDVLEVKYGKKVAFVGSILTYLMVNPAPYILSLGILIKALFGISLIYAILISGIIAMIYTLLGGFKGVIYTDLLQCIIMYISFIMLAVFSFKYFGGIEYLKRYITHIKGYENHLTLKGNLSWLYIFAWAGISLIVLVDPNFYQRCYATVKPKTAVIGILISIVLWAIFDILSCTTALYCLAGKNAGILHLTDPKMGYIVLANKILPTPFKGIFIVGLFSVIMSTLDSYIFVGGINISRDFYWRFINRESSEERNIFITKIGIIISTLIGIILAIFLPSIVDLWFIIGTISCTGLIIPMIYALYTINREISDFFRKGILLTILIGPFISIIWNVLNNPYEIPSFYPGIVSSLLVFCYFYFFNMINIKNKRIK